METMLDSALIQSAISGGTVSEFGIYCDQIGSCFGLTLSEVAAEYLSIRGFSKIHQILLGIDRSVSLEDYLYSLEEQERHILINTADSRGRTPLTWAVEFGWPDAARILFSYGANPNGVQRGDLSLLHLALAGPSGQFLKSGFVDVIDQLLEAGADINSTDCEGWTPLHIAASWGLCNLGTFFPPARVAMERQDERLSLSG